MSEDGETEKLRAGKALWMLAALVILIAGLPCWLAVPDFRIPWGILAFFLNFIPVIGSIVAGAPPTILALLVAGVPNTLFVAGGISEEALLEETPPEEAGPAVGTEIISA